MAFVGSIKSFNESKGFGFIECDQTQKTYGKDMFVLKTSIPGGNASRGDQVSFNVVQEHNGPVAKDVQFLSRSMSMGPSFGAAVPVPAPAAVNGNGSSYVGRIKSFDESRGFGFIECDQTQRMYGKDMFVLKTDIPGGTANRGEQVSFIVVQEHNGPVAKDVQFYGNRSMPMGPRYGAPVPIAAAAVNGSSYVGTVKSFNQDKGWGMIQCPQTEQVYRKDIFFSSAAVLGGYVQVGEQVTFSLKMEAKGPAAASVMRGVARQMMMPPMVGGAMMMGNGMVQGGYGMVGGGMPVKPDQLFFGRVKTWNDEKGWGHISCDFASRVYGKDVFLMRGQLKEKQDLDSGSLVSFKVQPSAKGPQAQSVSVLPPDSFKTDDGEGGVAYWGTVKTFSEEKGWGFLEGEEIKQVFGKDIFLHKRELGDVLPSNGDSIQFQVEIDDKGQPVAKNVNLEEAYGAVAGDGNAARARSSPY